MIFGMVCNVLGPTIPWLAGRAGVQPEALGLLPFLGQRICLRFRVLRVWGANNVLGESFGRNGLTEMF